MRVRSHLLDCMHLDPGYALLSVQNCVSCLEMFRMMDIHNNASLNDFQFEQFLKIFSDLNKHQADTLFELLDIDHSGEMEFEEFYLVFCILVSCKDQYEKEFIYRHSTNIFRLIDADASGLICGPEFKQMGVLFNFDYNSIHSIFDEFDVSGDKNLDFMEFRLFTMACIDEQRCADALVRVKVLTKYHVKLLKTLEFFVRMYFIAQKLPKPMDLESLLARVPDPFVPETRRRFSFIDWSFIRGKLTGHGALIHRVKVLQNWFYKLIRFLCCWFCCCILGRKMKSRWKDSVGWKCCRKYRRRRYQKQMTKSRLLTNLNRCIKIQRKKLKLAERQKQLRQEKEERNKGVWWRRLKRRWVEKLVAAEPGLQKAETNRTSTLQQQQPPRKLKKVLTPAKVASTPSSEDKILVNTNVA